MHGQNQSWWKAMWAILGRIHPILLHNNPLEAMIIQRYITLWPSSFNLTEKVQLGVLFSSHKRQMQINTLKNIFSPSEFLRGLRYILSLVLVTLRYSFIKVEVETFPFSVYAEKILFRYITLLLTSLTAVCWVVYSCEWRALNPANVFIQICNYLIFHVFLKFHGCWYGEINIKCYVARNMELDVECLLKESSPWKSI